MERRQFIECTSVAMTGLLVSTLIGGCTQKGNILLNDSIGAQENILQSFLRQGDDNFSFYILNNGSFEHSNIKGDKTYVFCESGKIVGYTITSENMEEGEKWGRYIKKKFGVAKINYENSYGTSQHWQKDNRKITISLSGNQQKNIPKKMFYSEVIASSALMITD